MIHSSWFKAAWIILSFAGCIYFAFTADERPDPQAFLIPIAFGLSFIAAIIYTGKDKPPSAPVGR